MWLAIFATAALSWLFGLMTGYWARGEQRRPTIPLAFTVTPTRQWKPLDLPAIKRRASIPTVTQGEQQ